MIPPATVRRAEKREIELAEVGPEAPHDWVASALPRSDNLLSLPVDVEGSPPNNWDDMTESLVRPTAPVPQGLDWPLAPSANRKFLITTGFHPFVSPAADPRLQSSRCPWPWSQPAMSSPAGIWSETNGRPSIAMRASARRTFWRRSITDFPSRSKRVSGLAWPADRRQSVATDIASCRSGCRPGILTIVRTRQCTSCCWSTHRRACAGVAAWKSSAAPWATFPKW